MVRVLLCFRHPFLPQGWLASAATSLDSAPVPSDVCLHGLQTTLFGFAACNLTLCYQNWAASHLLGEKYCTERQVPTSSLRGPPALCSSHAAAQVINGARLEHSSGVFSPSSDGCCLRPPAATRVPRAGVLGTKSTLDGECIGLGQDQAAGSA